MASISKVDQLLDEWEERKSVEPGLSLDQFINDRLNGQEDELVHTFRREAEKLEEMDAVLSKVAGRCATFDQTMAKDVGELQLSILSPGYEPISGYTLVSRLGVGGFGEVWKAEAPGGFHVALKFVEINSRVCEVEERSLDVIKDVRHPNLLSVVGTWRIGNFLVIATELADRTLLDRLEEAQKEGHEGIPREELLVYFAEAAKGIDFLNEPGKSGRMRIQHRDIKPQNLLLSGGSVKVGDFGLARSVQYDVTGHTGSLTFAYAAPECFDGTTSTRSDQYSLAATYCHLRGGRLPFEGTQVEVMDGHRKRQPDLSMLPVEERHTVSRALAKLPKDRWKSCSEFVSTLTKPSSGTPSTESRLSEIASNVEHPSFSLGKWAYGSIGLAIAILLFVMISMIGGTRSNSQDYTKSESNRSSDVESSKREIKGPVTLAVMDFDNHSQDPNLEGFRLGFRDMLVTDLLHITSVKVLERGRLRDLLDEHKLAKSVFIDPKSAVRLRNGLSANHLLSGSYVIQGENIRIDVRVISVETGEVTLAQSVEGKKSNMFGLQKQLSTKVLAGLGIQPSDAELAELNKPQTKDYEAFRLYSEARLAELKGEQEKAKEAYDQALKLDPTSPLIGRELDRLETAALFRLSESQQQKARTSGEVGRRLKEHWEKHQQVVEQNRRDPEYFASILVLAAHAGLYGDAEQERKLLATYWNRFAESILPQNALEISVEINKAVMRESVFFQKTVDSGDYGIYVSLFEEKPGKKYLKSELRNDLHWPNWSVIWPFDLDARVAFGQVDFGKTPAMKDMLQANFHGMLASYPHDYLKNVVDSSGLSDDRLDNPDRFSERLKTYVSIALYYRELKDQPEGLVKNLGRHRYFLLNNLKYADVNQIDQRTVSLAIRFLDEVAKVSPKGDERELADQLLVRYISQARINDGGVRKESTPGAKEFKLFGKSLSGSKVLIVWQLPDLDDFDLKRIGVANKVKESLSDAVRTLSPVTKINLVKSDYSKNEVSPSLFDKLQPADAVTKKRSLEWLSRKRGFGGSIRPLREIIESSSRDLDEQSLVIIVALDDDPSIPERTIDFVSQAESCPAFCVVAMKKHKRLAQLAALSNGTAILLNATNDFGSNIIVEAWDISGEKPSQP